MNLILKTRYILRASLDGTHFGGNQTSCKFMEIVMDFPKMICALIGLVMTPVLSHPMVFGPDLCFG